MASALDPVLDYVTSDNPLLAGIRFPKPRPDIDVEWPVIDAAPNAVDHWIVYAPPLREGVTALDIGGIWASRYGGFEAVRGGRVRGFKTRQAAINWIWSDYLCA